MAPNDGGSLIAFLPLLIIVALIALIYYAVARQKNSVPSLSNDLSLQQGMTPDQRALFQYEMRKVYKNPSTAFILNLFGLHRFYLGKIGSGIVQWLLVPIGIGVLWILLDLFTVWRTTEDQNEQKAREIAAAVRLMQPAT